MGFSDKVTTIAIDEMDLKNKSDNHIPIPIKLDNVSHAMKTKKSVKKADCTFRVFVLPYYKICCFIVFIFLFLSSASQSHKKRKNNFQCLVFQPIFLHYWTKFTAFCVAEIFSKSAMVPKNMVLICHYDVIRNSRG